LYGAYFSNFSFSKPVPHTICQIVPQVTLWSLAADLCFSYEEIRGFTACIHEAHIPLMKFPTTHVSIMKSLALFDCELNDLCDTNIFPHHDILLRDKTGFLMLWG